MKKTAWFIGLSALSLFLAPLFWFGIGKLYGVYNSFFKWGFPGSEFPNGDSTSGTVSVVTIVLVGLIITNVGLEIYGGESPKQTDNLSQKI